ATPRPRPSPRCWWRAECGACGCTRSGRTRMRCGSPSGGPMADVLAANQGLYDAVEHGDLELMRSLWLPGDSTVCVHPGSEPVLGTAAVLRSWAVIMANTGYIQFILTDVSVQE